MLKQPMRTPLSIFLLPTYNVLNIAQAVGIVCYEWYQMMQHTSDAPSPQTAPVLPPTHGMITSLYDTLCKSLQQAGHPPLPPQRNKLLQMLLRLPLQAHDINAIHGIIRCIGGKG